MMNRPPTLSARQLRLVDRHAAMLPVHEREAFLRRVAGRLTGTPADGAVCHAINQALDVAREEFR